MNGLLRRTKRLEQKAVASTSNKKNMNWLKKMFGYVNTDTEPPAGFFPKGRENLERTFFKEDV